MIPAVEAKKLSDSVVINDRQMRRILNYVNDQIILQTSKGNYYYCLNADLLKNLNDLQVSTLLNTLQENGYNIQPFSYETPVSIFKTGMWEGYKITWK